MLTMFAHEPSPAKASPRSRAPVPYQRSRTPVLAMPRSASTADSTSWQCISAVYRSSAHKLRLEPRRGVYYLAPSQSDGRLVSAQSSPSHCRAFIGSKGSLVRSSLGRGNLAHGTTLKAHGAAAVTGNLFAWAGGATLKGGGGASRDPAAGPMEQQEQEHDRPQAIRVPSRRHRRSQVGTLRALHLPPPADAKGELQGLFGRSTSKEVLWEPPARVESSVGSYQGGPPEAEVQQATATRPASAPLRKAPAGGRYSRQPKTRMSSMLSQHVLCETLESEASFSARGRPYSASARCTAHESEERIETDEEGRRGAPNLWLILSSPLAATAEPSLVAFAVLADLLQGSLLASDKASDLPPLPIRPHADRLPSGDRGVSLAFLRGVRTFYSRAAGLHVAVGDVCKGFGSPISVCALTRLSGLSLAEDAVIAAAELGHPTDTLVGRATSYFSYSWTGTLPALRPTACCVERLLILCDCSYGRHSDRGSTRRSGASNRHT